MSEKNINTRIVNKHDIEANWIEASNFVPLKGEAIIYDADSTHSYIRVKIGDGSTLVTQLPFIAEPQLRETIMLSASDWTGTTSPYSQIVSVSGVMSNSKIDLQPTAAQLAELQAMGVALMTENDNGVITVYALNNKPTSDYTIQATITEIKEVGT